MDKDQLLENLGSYGYPLLKPVPAGEPEDVLKALLKQSDARLLEGFPVVLAHVFKERESLSWEKSKWNPENDLATKSRLRLAYLLGLSYYLFKLFGLPKEYQDRTLKLLFKYKSGNRLIKDLEEAFAKSESVKVDNVELSTERLKNNFRNYVVHAPGSAEAQEKKHALELELLLAELFTPRQKEVLRKRMEGKALTKTEREYFYRVVKKRLRVLANEELHQMARTLLLK